jgi:glycosyltransferase involved in cell wall biosynthesis
MDGGEPKKIKYIKNDSVKKSSSINVNNAIRHATGDIIKPIFQDDFINDPTCFEEINRAVENGAKWGATGFVHTDEYGNNRTRFMLPYYNKNMGIGVNTIGCPSNIFFTKDCNELFDENLEWLMDCEFYYRMQKKHPMTVINKILMVTRIWGNSVSYELSEEIKQNEALYVSNKHGL